MKPVAITCVIEVAHLHAQFGGMGPCRDRLPADPWGKMPTTELSIFMPGHSERMPKLVFGWNKEDLRGAERVTDA